MANLHKSALNRIFKITFFNKILFSFILIIIFTLSLLVYIVTSNITTVLQEKESRYANLILLNVNNYFESKNNLAKQISQQAYIDSFTIPEVFNFLQTSDNSDSSAFYELRSRFINYFHSAFSRDNDILNILIYKKADRNFYVFSRNSIDTNYPEDQFKYSNRLKQMDELPSTMKIIPAFSPGYYKEGKKKVYTLSTNIKLLGTNQSIGLLMIDLDPDGLTQTLSQYNKNLNGNILILTTDGDVVYDLSGKYYNKKYPFLDILKSQKKVAKIAGEDCIINVINKTNSPGIIIASVIPTRQIYSSIEAIQHIIILIAIICVLLSIILAFISTSLFSKRVKSITSAMKKACSGDLSRKIPVTNQGDEINEIAISFNKMCNDLNDYINKVFVSEIRQKSAELTALQAQVNPHFLYNTLEVIRMKAVTYGYNEVSEMIFLLANLFRSSIKDDQIIEIKDELKYSQMYLDLNRIRYGKKLTYNFDISKEIMSLGIIKHIIQPIIENYIVHGFNIDSDDNSIQIKGYQEDNFIYFIISDNGLGIIPDRLEEIRRSITEFNMNYHDSIGLINVTDRIKIIYGNECGLSIFSDIGKGTTIMIKIYAKAKKELEWHVQGINSR